MPIVKFGHTEVECEFGETLRKVLLRAGLPLHNGAARFVNCHGLGTCGTCAVKLRGSASWPTKIEQVRMRLPPHTLDGGLRLACQCKVHGDLVVEKFAGFWGQDTATPASDRHHHHHSVPSAMPEPSRAQDLTDLLIYFDPQRRRVPSLHRRAIVDGRNRTCPAMSDLPRVNVNKIRHRRRSS